MFETIIGLEVHVQLNTQSKLFAHALPALTTNKIPTRVRHKQPLPGALPVLNKEALRKAGMFGTAVGATINRTSFFDRAKAIFIPTVRARIKSRNSIPRSSNTGSQVIDFEDGTNKRSVSTAPISKRMRGKHP